MKIAKIICCALVVCGGIITGCGDDDVSNAEDERPAGSYDVVSDDDLDMFAEAGVSIYGGTDAPSIEGTYLMNDLEQTYKSHSEIDPDYTIVDYYYTFTPTDAEEYGLEVALEAPSEDHLVEGIGGYISGTDECFTIYAETSQTANDGNCTITNAELFSGCVGNNAIEDFENAYLRTGLDGDCGDREGQTLNVIEDDYCPKQ